MIYKPGFCSVCRKRFTKKRYIVHADYLVEGGRYPQTPFANAGCFECYEAGRFCKFETSGAVVCSCGRCMGKAEAIPITIERARELALDAVRKAEKARAMVARAEARDGDITQDDSDLMLNTLRCLEMLEWENPVTDWEFKCPRCGAEWNSNKDEPDIHKEGCQTITLIRKLRERLGIKENVE